MAGFNLFEIHAEVHTGKKKPAISFYYADNLPPTFFDFYNYAIKRIRTDDLAVFRKKSKKQAQNHKEGSNVMGTGESDDVVDKLIQDYYKDGLPEESKMQFCKAMALIAAKDAVFGSIRKAGERLFKKEEVKGQKLNGLLDSFSDLITKASDEIEYLRLIMDEEDIYEIWFGITKMPGPDRNKYQYGQVGLVKGERFSRIFRPWNRKFRREMRNSLITVIESKNDYFTSDEDVSEKEWKSRMIDEKKKEHPYFLGLFFKLVINKKSAEFITQLAVGLPPYEMEIDEDGSLENTQVIIEKLGIPTPVSENTRSKAPIALIDFTINTEIMKDNLAIPVHFKFGHIGKFKNGLLETGKSPLLLRILDGLIFKHNLRICDSIPRLMGHHKKLSALKVDINIRELEFYFIPQELKNQLKNYGLINKKELLAKEKSKPDIILPSLDTIEERRVSSNRVDPTSVLKLFSSNLILNLGLGFHPFKRLIPLSGKMGDADIKFIDSINEMIKEKVGGPSKEDWQEMIQKVIPDLDAHEAGGKK
ncbi:glutamate racemase [Candidatus Scalindua japonica]|uniref:Glutamate racemase n=2 Tax=Candidatus Scalindua japonica TaxID=1284222 RepID=A0A286TTW4_9BACT|nr:glutamate racemase [Candidatus Scalindua japonica]